MSTIVFIDSGVDLTSYRFANVSGGGEMSLGDSGALATRTIAGTSTFRQAWSSALLAGKSYWEMAVVTRSSTAYSAGIGLATTAGVSFNSSPWYGVILSNGSCGVGAGYWSGGSLVDGAYTYSLNDRIGFAYDATTRKLWISINGSFVSGNPVAGTGETATLASNSYVPSFSAYDCFGGAGTMEARIYVTAAEFSTAPPSGFSAYAP